jgi:predicted RNA binding protein YcfA (HicA-like mRNA interferase family)
MLALPHLSAAECVTALGRLGFRTHRERAGRIVLRRSGRAVIVPQAATLGPALVASIVRSAGVDPLEFLRALDAAPWLPRPRESTPIVA